MLIKQAARQLGISPSVLRRLETRPNFPCTTLKVGEKGKRLYTARVIEGIRAWMTRDLATAKERQARVLAVREQAAKLRLQQQYRETGESNANQ